MHKSNINWYNFTLFALRNFDANLLIYTCIYASALNKLLNKSPYMYYV